MRRLLDIVLAFILVLLSQGCDFRDLTDPVNLSYVRIYVDESLLNVTKGFYNEDFYHPGYTRPEILRVGIFDAANGELVADRYLRDQGDDELGHFYEGLMIIHPGTYNVVAYNFGTEATVLSDEDNCFGMLATTNEIPSSISSKLKSRTAKSDFPPDESIRYDADHLFVADAENLTVKYHQKRDTLRSSDGKPYFVARSLVKSYYIQIGLTGAKFLSSSSALLTGMARASRPLDRDFESHGETTIYFEMNSGSYTSLGEDHACIYATFGTFGRLSATDSELTVTFELLTTYGERFEKTLSMNLEFLKDDAIERQWLIIDEVIDIPPPPEGDDDGKGLAPSVDEWSDIESDINI